MVTLQPEEDPILHLEIHFIPEFFKLILDWRKHALGTTSFL